MKTRILFGAIALIASSVIAADSGAKDEIKAAAKKLGDNYTWKTSTENAGGGGPGGGRGMGGGPAEGKVASGTTWLSFARRDTTMDVFMTSADKAALKTEEGWRSMSEMNQDAGGGGGFNPGAFLARSVRNFKAPATQASELADQTKTLAKEGDAYSGELTEEGAKSLLAFRGGPGGQGPNIQNAKGTVKFWVQDGKLTKYQYNVKGTVTFGDNDREIDRTITTEIRDIGTTKVEVPAEAKAKLS